MSVPGYFAEEFERFIDAAREDGSDPPLEVRHLLWMAFLGGASSSIGRLVRLHDNDRAAEIERMRDEIWSETCEATEPQRSAEVPS